MKAQDLITAIQAEVQLNAKTSSGNPKINYVYNTDQEEESKDNDDEDQANYVKEKYKGKKKKKFFKNNQYKPKFKEKDKWKKTYSNNTKNKDSDNEEDTINAMVSIKCYNCGKMEHFAKGCAEPRKGNSSVNNTKYKDEKKEKPSKVNITKATHIEEIDD